MTAAELRDRVFEVIARPAVSRHFKFCDQIGASSRSGAANIAEGFWRRRRDAWTERYIADEEYRKLSDLPRHAIAVAIRWHTHLMKCSDRGPSFQSGEGKTSRLPNRKP